MYTMSSRATSLFSEIVKFTLIALLIVIPFRMFIAQPFIVNGASMVPTFASGDYLIVDQLTYAFGEPSRGSVVVFKFPENPSKFFIKRVIGLPKETINVRDGEVYVVNEANPEGLRLNEPYIRDESENNLNVELGEDEYFVMGDNRLQSSDSRSWGPLDKQFIVGRPIVRLFPPTAFELMPGKHIF